MRLEGFDSPWCLAFGHFIYGMIVETVRAPSLELLPSQLPSHRITLVRMLLTLWMYT